MREQTGALAPPSFDENKLRQSRKGGVMGAVFSGKSRLPEVNYELSLEMNKKMQSVLEDTLLKNITLKVSALWCVWCAVLKSDTRGGRGETEYVPADTHSG